MTTSRGKGFPHLGPIGQQSTVYAIAWMSRGNMIHQYLEETIIEIHTVTTTNKHQGLFATANSPHRLRFPYFNIDCSFASSFFCRSMTPRMIRLSSSVRWLRSGNSGMTPAAEAAAGPGPPRGPCGADIFYTQWLKKTRKAPASTSSILGYISCYISCCQNSNWLWDLLEAPWLRDGMTSQLRLIMLHK